MFARAAGLVVMALGLAGLVCAGLAGYAGLQDVHKQEQAEADARTFARMAARWLTDVDQELASDPVQRALADTVESGGDAGPLLVRTLGPLGVDSIPVVVAVPPALEALEPDETLDYVMLDLLIEARRSGRTTPDLRLQGAGGQPELLMARRIEADDELTGLLLLGLPAPALARHWTPPEWSGFLSVGQQRGQRWEGFWTHGQSDAGQLRRVPVSGSRLEVAWRRSASTPIALEPGQSAALAGMGLVLLLAGFLLLRRQPAPSVGSRRASSARPATAAPKPAQSPQVAEWTPPATPPPAASPPEPEPKPAESAAKTEAKTEDAPPDAAAPDGPGSEGLHLALDDDFFADQGRGDPAGLPTVEEDDPDSLILDLSTESEPTPPKTEQPPATDDATNPVSEEPASLEMVDQAAEDTADEVESVEPASPPSPAPLRPDEDDLMLALEEEEQALPDLPESVLVTAEGLFGRTDDGFDADFVERLGAAVGGLAAEAGCRRLVVARDGRLHSPILLEGLVQGLRASGIDALQLGAVPAPVLRFAAMEVADRSGVIVSGSERAAEWNGLQIVLDGATLEGPRLARRLADDAASRTGEQTGGLEELAVSTRYIERLAAEIQLERPLKVVVDCANGVCGLMLPRLFQAIGADLIPLYADVDGSFPNHPPDPGNAAYLDDLRLCVRSFGADLGLAFDGDGQRVNLVAGNGDILWPDSLLMLLARSLWATQPGAVVVCDALTSSRLQHWAEPLGGSVVRAGPGPVAIEAAAREQGAALAGSFSGQLLLGRDDSLVPDCLHATCRLLEILAADTRSVEQILAELPERVSLPLVRLDPAGLQVWQVLERFCEQAGDGLVRDDYGLVLESADAWAGIVVDEARGHLLVRIEGRDEHAAERLRVRVSGLLADIDPALALPA